MDSLWVTLEDTTDLDPVEEGTWTQAMEIENVGCIVKAFTIYNNLDGTTSNSESMVFVPWTKIGDRVEEEITVGKKLVPFQKF